MTVRFLVGAALRRTHTSILLLYSVLSKTYYRAAYPGLFIGSDVMIFPSARIMMADGGRIHIASGSSLNRRCSIQALGGNIHIGEGGFIGEATMIVSAERIDIGRDALIAEHVTIRDHDHPVPSDRTPRRLKHMNHHPITIGDDVWIAAGVVITSGVDIGDGSVIGAGSVVTRNIPMGVTAVGIPAKPVRISA